MSLRELRASRTDMFEDTMHHHAASRRWGSPPGALTAQIVDNERGLQDLRAEWQTVRAATGGDNPFTHWAWIWHWWHALREPGGLPSPGDRLHIIVMRDQEMLVRAIVPLILTVRGRGPLSVRLLRMYGFARNASFTEMPAPLVWPGWEAAAAGCLLAALHAERRRYDCCILDGLPMDGELGQWFASQGEADGWCWRPPVQDYILPLPATWEELRVRLKRNVKESLRHCYNSLKRDGHEWSFETVTDPVALPAALDEFFRLHSTRAESDRGPQHPNHFPTLRRQSFLRRVAHDMAAEGQFMVCRLRVNGAVVASRIAFAAGESVYLYYSGFDPDWSRYSVMTTLTAECIKIAIATGARAVNLSPGIDISKTRWGPQEQIFGGLRIVSPRPAARVIVAVSDRLEQLRTATPASSNSWYRRAAKLMPLKRVLATI